MRQPPGSVETYQHLIFTTMPSKQPSFAQRIELLKLAVKSLDDVASTIDAEVERMIAAEKRFSERKGQKRERRARE